jgi:hypothetical protein
VINLASDKCFGLVDVGQRRLEVNTAVQSGKSGLKSCLLSTGLLSLGTMYRGAGKSLARPGRKQATATEDFDIHISYL